MKRIYLIAIGLFFSISAFAIAPITGFTTACAGAGTNLFDATSGGSWTSSNTVVATISGSGVLAGISAGTTVITYTVGASFATTVVTINPSPAPIAGTSGICVSSTLTLSDATFGGTWYSSNPGIASVDSTGFVTGITVGTAMITYVLATGCKSTTLVTINATPSAIVGSANLCPGTTATLSDAAPSGLWSSSNTSIATIGSSTGIIAGVSPGTTTIAYTTSCGSIFTSVTVPVAPASISGPSGVCAGASETLSDTTVGGSWSSSSSAIAAITSGSGHLTGVSTGTAIISYGLSSGCYTVFPVTVNATPASITGPASACLGAATALTDSSIGGNWSSANPTVATISALGTVALVSPGTCTISYTLPSTGCFVVQTETVYPSPTPIYGSSSVCQGDNTTVYDGVSGGVWSTSSALVTIGLTSGVISGISAGTASVTYTIAGSCKTDTIININPTPSISGPSSLCTGSTYSYSGSIPGGAWNSSGPMISLGSSSGAVACFSPGTTVITYTVPTGCSSTLPIVVNATPHAISGTNNICAHTSFDFSDITGGGVWTSGNTAIASVGAGSGIVSGVSAGTVVLSYTLPTGCFTSAPLMVNLAPSAISGPTSDCAGSTITLTDSVAGGTWTNPGFTSLASIGSTSGVVQGLSAGTVIVTYVLPSSGCLAKTSVFINALPSVISGPSALCADGGSLSLSDGLGGGVWTSSNSSVATVGTVGGLIYGISSGTATISYTLSTGCYRTKAITVNPVPGPIAGSDSVCLLSNIPLSDSYPGGIWTSSSFGASIGSSSGIVTGIGAGTGTITYTLGTGCFASTPFAVNPLPAVYTLTGGGAYCSGTTGAIVTLDGSQLGVNYKVITGGTVAGDTSGTGSAINFGPFTYPGSYSAVAINPVTGCSSNMISGVTISPEPSPAIDTLTGGGSYCSGGTGVAIRLGNSTVGVAYQLFNGGHTVGAPVNGTGSGFTFGFDTSAGTYTAVATNIYTHCTSNMAGVASVSVTPSVIPVVTISAAPGDSVCIGTPVTFTASSIFGGSAPLYSWTVNGVISSSATPTFHYTPANGDVVSVKLTSNAVCAYPDTSIVQVIATVYPLPAPITGPASICQGAVASLTDTTIGGTWISSDPSIALISTIGITTGGIIGVSSGTTMITYISPAGCETHTSLNINSLPHITASFTSESCGGKFVLTSSGGLSYSWSPIDGLSCDSCAITELQPSANGYYEVTGTDAFGCSDTAGVAINASRISGHITFDGPAPDSTEVMVWLLHVNPVDSSLISTDSTVTCSDNGSPYYEFDGLPTGNFLIKARLLYGNNPGSSGYFPSYDTATPHWADATTIVHAGGFDTLHFNMAYGTVPVGSGSISGSVYTATSTPSVIAAPGMLVFLFNATTGSVLTYNYTNDIGAYSFTGLAPGNYIVYPEEYVYNTVPSATIILDSTNETASEINFIQYNTSLLITPFTTNSVKTVSQDHNISIFPNPTTGILELSWSGVTIGAADVTVSNMLGQEELRSAVNCSSPSGSATIALGDLADGVYLLSIKGKNINYCTQVRLLK